MVNGEHKKDDIQSFKLKETKKLITTSNFHSGDEYRTFRDEKKRFLLLLWDINRRS